MNFLEDLEKYRRKGCVPEALHPLVLAYVGDTIFDLYVRTRMIYEHDEGAHALHVRSIGYVSAKAQAITYRRIADKLTEDERKVFTRGRNAKSNTIPKNASVADYHAATGLETLLGYLFLSKKYERLQQLLQLAVDEESGE